MQPMLLSTRSLDQPGRAAAIATFAKKYDTHTESAGFQNFGKYVTFDLFVTNDSGRTEMTNRHAAFFTPRGIESRVIDLFQIPIYEYAIGIPSIGDADLPLQYLAGLGGNLFSHRAVALERAAETGFVEYQLYVAVANFSPAQHEEFRYRIAQDIVYEYIRGGVLDPDDPGAWDTIVSYGLGLWQQA
jgi:hypothetical protein